MVGAAAALVVTVAVSVGFVVTQSAGSPSRGHNALPSWLPKSTIPVGRVVTASAAHPWLAIEGDTVLVRLSKAHALVTVVGPAVPEEGQFPLPETTPCTFTVSIIKVTGTIPIAADAFSITDENGRVHRPQLSASGGSQSPTQKVTANHSVTLTLQSVLPTGNGTLQWAPGGGKPIVSWDFSVEID